jgi:hypothetical protein
VLVPSRRAEDLFAWLGLIDRLARDAGSGGRYTGHSSATRADNVRIEYGQPTLSAITVASKRGNACNNSRIRGSNPSTTARQRVELPRVSGTERDPLTEARIDLGNF